MLAQEAGRQDASAMDAATVVAEVNAPADVSQPPHLIISADAMGLVVGRLDGPLSRGRTGVTSALIPDAIKPLFHSTINDQRSTINDKFTALADWLHCGHDSLSLRLTHVTVLPTVPRNATVNDGTESQRH